MGPPSLPREGCLIELRTALSAHVRRRIALSQTLRARVRGSQNSTGANSLPPHDLSPGTARSWEVLYLLGPQVQAHNLNVNFIRAMRTATLGW